MRSGASNRRRTTDAGGWIFLALFGAFLIFCLWMAAQIPYTHDDWDWGLPVGLTQLFSANLNSRYAGNLLEVLLTRSAVLKTAVLGLTFCLLPAVAAAFAMERRADDTRRFPRPAVFCLGCVLLFTIPASVWRQTCGWVAGFSNFVFSALMIGIFLLLCRDLFEDGRIAPCRVGGAVGRFLFCIAAQLFLENLTVYFFAAALAFFLADWVRFRRPSLRYGSMLAGTAAGAAVMFSSSMYHTLLSTGEAVGGYRQLTFQAGDGLGAIAVGFLKRFFADIAPGIWEENRLLCAVSLVCAALVLIHNRRCLARWLLVLLGFCHAACLVVCGLLWAGWTPALSAGNTAYFHVAVNGGIFLLVALELLLCLRKRPRKLLKMLGLWVSAPLVMAPMVVINTVGPRSFFTSDFFLLLFCLMAAGELISELHKPAAAAVGVAAALALCAVCVRWAVIYSDIGAVKAQRAAQIEEAAEGRTDEITLSAYPHAQYLWMPDPANERREGYFRAFYGIPEQVTIHFESKEDGQ